MVPPINWATSRHYPSVALGSQPTPKEFRHRAQGCERSELPWDKRQHGILRQRRYVMACGFHDATALR